MIKIYGIPNCDTVKKARVWLGAQGVAHSFHDFRKDGLDSDKVVGWLETVGSELLVNRKSTTWRQLSDEEKQLSGDELIALLVAQPTLIKRPVFEVGGKVLVGFKPEVQEQLA
jgi:Spx/MgsR family transcriptional regulator